MPTVVQLREECKRLGIKGYSTKLKAELEKLCVEKNKKKSPNKSKSKSKSKSPDKSRPKKSKSKGDKTKAQLIEDCKKYNIRGYSGKTKSELEEYCVKENKRSPAKKSEKKPKGLGIGVRSNKFPNLKCAVTYISGDRGAPKKIMIRVSNNKLIINEIDIEPKELDDMDQEDKDIYKYFKEKIKSTHDNLEAKLITQLYGVTVYKDKIVELLLQRLTIRLLEKKKVSYYNLKKSDNSYLLSISEDDSKNSCILTSESKGSFIDKELERLEKGFIEKKDPEPECDSEECKEDSCDMKDIDNLPCMKGKGDRTLKSYQRLVIKQLLGDKKGLLAVHGIGSGKTLTAVTASQCLLATGKVKGVLLITKKGLIDNFKTEMDNYGVKTKSKELYQYESFEKVRLMANTLEKAKNLGKDKLIIIDEAHVLRADTLKSSKGEKGGKNARAAMNVCKYAKKVLLLTATPVVNKESEIINLMSLVDGKDPITKNKFDKHILNDPEELRRYFNCNISYFKCDRLKDKDSTYPTDITHQVNLKMNKEYYKDYLKVQKNLELEYVGKTLSNMFYTGVRQMSNNIDYKNPDKSQKVQWIMDFLLNNKNGPVKNPKMKTVIYSNYLQSGIDSIAKLLDDNDIEFSRISGTEMKSEDALRARQMSNKKRTEELNRYNKGDSNILLISAAGGTGLNLKATRNFILFEPQWNRAIEEQAIGRAIRSDSHTHLPKDERYVDVYRLRLSKDPTFKEFDDDKPSIDDYLIDYVFKKDDKLSNFVEKFIKPYSIEVNSYCK